MYWERYSFSYIERNHSCQAPTASVGLSIFAPTQKRSTNESNHHPSNPSWMESEWPVLKVFAPEARLERNWGAVLSLQLVKGSTAKSGTMIMGWYAEYWARQSTAKLFGNYPETYPLQHVSQISAFLISGLSDELWPGATYWQRF